LELQLKESRKMSEEYQEKAETATQKHEEIQLKLNEAMTGVVSIQSIRKDRDERVASMRTELEDLEQRAETRQRESIQIRVKHDKI